MEAPRKCRFAQCLRRPIRSITSPISQFRWDEHSCDSAEMASLLRISVRVKKYHRPHKGGDGPDTALGSSVWWSLVFSPPTWSIPPGKEPRRLCQNCAWRRSFWPVRIFSTCAVDFGWKLARAAPLKEASPLKCFADVRFVPSSQSIPPDGNAVAELPAIPFAQFLRRR